MVRKNLILTNRELGVIGKRLKNERLNQQDSNYLSRYVRPKLREIANIDSRMLLKKLEYNQKIPAIEKYIKDLVLKNVKYVSSITIFGSAIYNNYEGNNDIDVLVVVKKKIWKRLGEKFLLEKKIEKNSKLKLDIKIYTQEFVYYSYSSNVTLIYELKDSKTIYGILKYKKDMHISKLYLKMHSDYSELVLVDIKDNGLSYVTAKSLYGAIRNLWVIRLIMDGVVDNIKLNQMLEAELGKNMVDKLKNNTKIMPIKQIAYTYLKWLYGNTLILIGKLKGDIIWERDRR